MRDGDALSIQLPAAVAGVLDALQRDGGEAVLVGGCVRDELLSELEICLRDAHDQ